MPCAVSYVPPAGDPIEVPSPDAAEQLWVDACERTAAVLCGGGSLAFAAAGFVELGKATDIETRAKVNMTGLQLAQYNAWKQGAVKLNDEWNWDKTASVGHNPKTKSEWQSKAAALARLYGREVTSEQTKAWVLGNWELHALWKAVVHVIHAERAACGGHAGWCPLAFAEAVACRKFLRRLASHTYGKESPNEIFASVRAQVEARLKDVDGAVKE